MCFWINTSFSTFTTQFIGELIKFSIQTDLDEDVVLTLEKNLALNNIKLLQPELPLQFNDDYQFKLLDWSPMEIAKQITLIDMKLFQKIQPEEYNFYQLKDEKRSQCLSKLMKHSKNLNFLTYQIILTKDDIENRIEHLMFLIDILDSLITLRNYQSAMIIYNALLSNPIYRLSKTWNQIAEESEKIFKDFKELASSKRNYKNLKDNIAKNDTACIPPIEIYLNEIEPISKENSQKINFNHKRKISKVMEYLLLLQKRCIYPFKDVNLVQDFIMLEIKGQSQDELQKISLKLED